MFTLHHLADKQRQGSNCRNGSIYRNTQRSRVAEAILLKTCEIIAHAKLTLKLVGPRFANIQALTTCKSVMGIVPTALRVFSGWPHYFVAIL